VENKHSVKVHTFGLGDAGGGIDSRVGDLCNHVGFTDVAAPRGCWRLFEQNKSPGPDSRLRERADHSVALSLNLYLSKKRAETDLLHLTCNYLSSKLGFESIGLLISALSTKIGSTVVIRT
jgi:hypothetical protein